MNHRHTLYIYLTIIFRYSIVSTDLSIGSSVESEEFQRKKSLNDKTKKDNKTSPEKEKKKAKSGEKKKPEKPVKGNQNPDYFWKKTV